MYFSQARICLQGILLAGDYEVTCREGAFRIIRCQTSECSECVHDSLRCEPEWDAAHRLRSPDVDQSRSAGSPIVTSFLRAQQPWSSSTATDLNTHMRPARYRLDAKDEIFVGSVPDPKCAFLLVEFLPTRSLASQAMNHRCAGDPISCTVAFPALSAAFEQLSSAVPPCHTCLKWRGLSKLCHDRFFTET